jgi:hypothetical protein
LDADQIEAAALGNGDWGVPQPRTALVIGSVPSFGKALAPSRVSEVPVGPERGRVGRGWRKPVAEPGSPRFGSPPFASGGRWGRRRCAPRISSLMPGSTKKARARARSRAQRMEALERATEVRLKRAELKKQLKAGKLGIEEILGCPPDYLQTAKVADLLLALPNIGPAKASRLLTRCQISESKTVGALSERQREALVDRLQGGDREA